MANLINTAKINDYQYDVTTGQTLNGVSNDTSLTIDVTAATVTFTKENTPQYITLGGSTTINYVITNNNTELLTTATIVDPLFALVGVSTGNVENATLLGSTLTVNLGTGLAQNSSITVSVTATVSDTATPSSSIYDTVSTGTFTIATLPTPSVVTTTAKGLLEVNAALVQLVKSVSPNVVTTTAGNLLTFTITATNSGNVTATIPIGQFTDTWSVDGLTNVQTSTPGFQVINNTISNNEIITVNAGGTFTLTYTGTAAVPVV